VKSPLIPLAFVDLVKSALPPINSINSFDNFVNIFPPVTLLASLVPKGAVSNTLTKSRSNFRLIMFSNY
jgi:hypothetical protein